MAAAHLTIRSFRESDVEFVISRQLNLYETEYGFASEIWKAYVTEGVHHLVNHFDGDKDCLYILEHDGVSAGAIAIAHVDETTAQLRFFFIEATARGLGAGRKLIDLAIDFCKDKNYRHLFLWTISALYAARHLYGSKGFQITETHESSDWGATVLEERWDLDL